MTNTNGVLNEKSETISSFSSSSEFPDVTGGMKIKLSNAVSACKLGIKNVIIINYKNSGSLLEVLFSENITTGTIIK